MHVIVWHVCHHFTADKDVAAAMMGDEDVVRRLWNDRHYEPVAHVYSDDDEQEILDLAFRLTNHIDQHWNRRELVEQTPIEERNITPFHYDNNRSTSVGDIMVIGGSRVFMVDRVGFKLLEPRTKLPTKMILAKGAIDLGFTFTGPFDSYDEAANFRETVELDAQETCFMCDLIPPPDFV